MVGPKAPGGAFFFSVFLGLVGEVFPLESSCQAEGIVVIYIYMLISLYYILYTYI